MKVLAAAAFAAIALTAAACGTSSSSGMPSDAQTKWQADTAGHGGPTEDVYNPETNKVLGDAICGDLHKGTPASSEVMGISNTLHITMPQSMVATYWAITDLCPDQMSQRQDHWSDGH